MKKLEVTWWRVIRIWWAWAWRYILYIVVISFPLGFTIGLVAGMTGYGHLAESIGNIVSALMGIPLSIWVLKVILEKQYSDFQIMLVPSFESYLDDDSDGGNE